MSTNPPICRYCGRPLEPERHTYCDTRCRNYWRRNHSLRHARERHRHSHGILAAGDETATSHRQTGADLDQ